MLITHDLGVIAEMADDVVVMYLGRVVEQGPVDDIFHAPKHPYTRALLRSIPSIDAPSRGRSCRPSAGSIPHPYNRPTGCPSTRAAPTSCPGTCDTADARRCSRVGDAPGGELLPLRADADRPVAMAGRSPDAAARPTHAARGRAACRSSSRSAAACCAETVGHVRAVDDVSFDIRPGRDAGAGRRERLRQDHDRALHPARDRRRPAGEILLPHRGRRGGRRGHAAAGASCGRCAARCR